MILGEAAKRVVNKCIRDGIPVDSFPKRAGGGSFPPPDSFPVYFNFVPSLNAFPTFSPNFQ